MRAAFRRLGTRRLDRRQSAQVAVHAVRLERVLLPADGCRARGVLTRARVPQDRRGIARRAEPDGYRRSARPAVPIFKALDDSSALWSGKAALALSRPPAAGARLRRAGG